MALARFLLDTSASSRLGTSAVRNVVGPLLDRALVATCGVLDLEALYSARSPSDYVARREQRTELFEYVDTDEADLRRAREVQRALAATSRHRAVNLPDLVASAVAERHRLTVLHYDGDFDLVGEITGQTRQWVVGRGSVA